MRHRERERKDAAERKRDFRERNKRCTETVTDYLRNNVRHVQSYALRHLFVKRPYQRGQADRVPIISSLLRSKGAPPITFAKIHTPEEKKECHLTC